MSYDNAIVIINGVHSVPRKDAGHKRTNGLAEDEEDDLRVASRRAGDQLFAQLKKFSSTRFTPMKRDESRRLLHTFVLLRCGVFSPRIVSWDTSHVHEAFISEREHIRLELRYTRFALSAWFPH